MLKCIKHRVNVVLLFPAPPYHTKDNTMENLQSLINEHFPNASINDEIKKSTYDACSILLPNATPKTAKLKKELDFIAKHANKFSGCVTLSGWTTIAAFEKLTMGGYKIPLLLQICISLRTLALDQPSSIANMLPVL